MNRSHWVNQNFARAVPYSTAQPISSLFSFLLPIPHSSICSPVAGIPRYMEWSVESSAPIRACSCPSRIVDRLILGAEPNQQEFPRFAASILHDNVRHPALRTLERIRSPCPYAPMGEHASNP